MQVIIGRDPIGTLLRKERPRTVYPLLMDEKGEVIMTDMQKPEGLNNIFASVFPASQASQVFHFPEPMDGGWEAKSHLL